MADTPTAKREDITNTEIPSIQPRPSELLRLRGPFFCLLSRSNLDQYSMIKPLLIAFICLLAVPCQGQQALSLESELIASLIDPGKLSTLGERRANPRVQKAVAILLVAKQAGTDPGGIVNDSIVRINWAGTEKGKLTADALIRNLTIVERLGADTAADIVLMKKGRSPTVRKGPYAGDIVSVDHIIPRAVVPELDNVIANLELMPMKMNREKSAKIGARQLSVARKFHAAGLLSDLGFQRVSEAEEVEAVLK